jgi:hypothetical protein
MFYYMLFWRVRIARHKLRLKKNKKEADDFLVIGAAFSLIIGISKNILLKFITLFITIYP